MALFCEPLTTSMIFWLRKKESGDQSGCHGLEDKKTNVMCCNNFTKSRVCHISSRWARDACNLILKSQVYWRIVRPQGS